MKQEANRSKSAAAPDSEFRWWEIDGSDIRFLVRRHLAFVLVLLFLFAAGGYALTKWMRPVFSSRAVVYLRPNFERDIELQSSFSKLEDDDSLRSVEMAMVSDTVLLNTIEKLDLREKEDFLGPTWIGMPPTTDYAVLKRIRKRYRSKLIPNTRLVELRVKDYSAERSKLLAETMIDEFLAHLKAERDRKQKVLRATLVEQSDAALAAALKSEKELESFRADNPDMIVEQDSEVFQERLLQYGEALNEAIAEKSDIEGTLLALKSIDPKEEPYRIFQILQNRNSEYLSDLMRMHAEAKSQLASVAERNTADHPAYREAAGELKEVETTIAKYATEMKSGLESEFEAASGKVEKFTEELTKVQKEFVAFKSKSAEFRGIKEKIDRNWNTYSSLQEKITDLDLYPETELNFVTLISRPIVADKKSSPKGSFWAAGAGICGLLLAGISLLWRYRNGLPVTGEAQLCEESGVVSLGSVSLSGKHRWDGELLTPAISLCRYRILHFLSPYEEPILGRVSEDVARAYSSRNIRSLVIRMKDSADGLVCEVKPGDTLFLTTLEWPAERLLNPDDFVRRLSRYLENFDRVLVDSTELKSQATQAAIAALVEANVVLAAEGKGSRSSYKDCLSRLSNQGADQIFAMLVHERRRSEKSPKVSTDTKEVPEFSGIGKMQGKAAMM